MPASQETYSQEKDALNGMIGGGSCPVTPDDDADLPNGIAKGVLCLTAGTLSVICGNDMETGAMTVPAGFYYMCRTARVLEETDITCQAIY